MKSCLYFGEVTHHRKAPKKHDLRYKLFMPHLFLDELDQVFRGRIFWSINRSNLSCFQRADYHKPETDSLEEAVRSTMNQQLGDRVEGPISVLTHLRTFGHCFNPVTFYYAWNDRRDRPTAVLAEITNTPWNERYAKAFQWTEKDRLSKHEFVKEFHVSPFIDMQVDYDWRFEKPSENLRVDMILRQSGRTFFSAHLNLAFQGLRLRSGFVPPPRELSGWANLKVLGFVLGFVLGHQWNPNGYQLCVPDWEVSF